MELHGVQTSRTNNSRSVGGMNRKNFVTAEIESPYQSANISGTASVPMEKVSRRISDNPILHLFSRKRISQSEFLAGHKYLSAHLVYTGQTGQAIDYSRQRVDCSVAPMTLSEKQVHASDVIRGANRELSTNGANEKCKNEAVLRVQKIAGEGYTVTQYCKSVRGLTSNKSVSRQLGLLKKDLGVLAKMWGFEK